MIAYYILFAIIIILSLLCKKKFFYKKNGKLNYLSGNLIYIILVGVLLAFFMGLRSLNVGCDLIQYIYRYENSLQFYKLGISYSEWGYNYLSYFFSNILNVNFQFFLFIISSFCVFSVVKLIYKYSDNILLSIITYLTIGNFTFNMSGLRQTIAISLTLIALLMVQKRKVLMFYILIFLAITVHNSAVIFLPVYFLWGKNITRKQGLLLLFFAIAAFFYRQLLNPVILFLSPTKYTVFDLNAGYSINYLVILVPIVYCLYSILFIDAQKDGKLNLKNSFFYILSCINIFMLMLSLNNVQLGRLSYYFASGNLIIISSAINSHKKRDNKLASFIEFMIVLLALLYFFISIPGGTLGIDNYSFFWN